MNRPASSPTPRKRARETLSFLRDRETSDEKSEPKIMGPYRDRAKWRIVVFDGVSRRSVVADTEAEARRLMTELDREIIARSDRTVGELLPEYEAFLTTERGVQTAPDRCRQLARFLGTEQTLGSLTPKRAADLYAAECSRLTKRGTPSAAAGHRTYLASAKRLFSWAVERGYVSANPFADVRPIGRPKVGKTQLRIDEARRFVAVALKHAQNGDRLALAACMALMLGARASEVLKRLVRDVDDCAAILWIPYGKTKNAKRRLTVPDALRPMLAKLTEGRDGDLPLFFTPRKPAIPYTDAALWLRVRSLCSEASVPPVCTHSLRGLHATLAVSAGSTSEHVASALGHSSFAVTAKHYADGSAIADRKTAEVTGTLLAPRPTVAELARLASMLTLAERDELQAAIAALV